jgi:hypothetical protein
MFDGVFGALEGTYVKKRVCREEADDTEIEKEPFRQT